jgi:hypothetical protein
MICTLGQACATGAIFIASHLPPSSAPGGVRRGGRQTVEKSRASAIYRVRGILLGAVALMLGNC